MKESQNALYMPREQVLTVFAKLLTTLDSKNFSNIINLVSLCKAKFMNQIGKKTPIFLRFSTVAGERGANDCDRDPRGFAIKHYTEEGNYDMVGNNTPVFFIKDPIKFPDFIHS